MKGRIVGILSSIILAFAILMVSIFRGSASKYAFSSSLPTPKPEEAEEKVVIDYDLVFPGKILPGNPLWYIKVVRDKLQLTLTFDPAKKAELNLKNADKRLWASLMLFEKEKPDLGLQTLEKAELYLTKTLEDDYSGLEFSKKFALATLKHRQTIEQRILPLSPEDLQPEIIKIEGRSRSTYNKIRDTLRASGEAVPNNPFDSE